MNPPLRCAPWPFRPLQWRACPAVECTDDFPGDFQRYLAKDIAAGKGNICPGIDRRVLATLSDEQQHLVRAIQPQDGPPHASLSSLLSVGRVSGRATGLTEDDAIW